VKITRGSNGAREDALTCISKPLEQVLYQAAHVTDAQWPFQVHTD